ncbi:MAG: branched-chain alpha-keto acid dehydrogenase subunit E2 [Deltaproteobacteria bacterium GWA2_42_85]|nr:MAG: branched-chain alpha-keto acid dehydrogenase subunit E2 [Deltaproteobacteria bacterium GWA2_42_85]OGP38109.1 MAG: branched-chain alpha-keto acid dehydrogenase subunit E2 [Deltaproteobacteria bacterium GWD2_42_10]OGP47164.1 MAG: branched-chain alpha-keto acid dehydrogenase subunit E2 [Deltaproteobacteria bacterium GWF2_42_12]OGQ67633.1 MAG: branched-chain alpha-keto acid dehydrogenase subunit E2 [Deltaproteobacteria bacterium RIFCSPLOWO2_12_FULL_42_16]
MPFDFVLPDLGEGITEGEIRRWLVKEGDAVNEHQTILEVETDKAVVEVPSPKKGFVQKIRKLEGEIAKVGDVLLTIVEKLDVGEGLVPSQEKKSFGVVGRLPEAEEVLATPAVRNLAKRLSVDIEKIKGTGPAGRITEDDVVKASGGAKELFKDQYGSIERVPIKGVRRSIAKNLLASMRTAAFVTGMDDADVSGLWKLREKEKKVALKKEIKLTFLPFFMKAVQHAIKEHPMLNASVDEQSEEVIVKKYYNIGVAVDTSEGLMVPVVKDVDKKTILELAKELQELSVKAKDRKLKLEELKGSTFTISNFGSFGGTYATPIINYPDVAILGTGKISDRPWVKDGQIVIRKVLSLSLTFDHRVVDGAEAAKFLNKIIGYLEDPDQIFIESA